MAISNYFALNNQEEIVFLSISVIAIVAAETAIGLGIRGIRC